MLLCVHLHTLVQSCVYRTATKSEINKAYRKLARKWHPDSYNGQDQEHAEKMFLDIAAAKEVLTDPGRLMYMYVINFMVHVINHWTLLDSQSSSVHIIIPHAALHFTLIR